jgi:hypothetical protein
VGALIKRSPKSVKKALKRAALALALNGAILTRFHLRRVTILKDLEVFLTEGRAFQSQQLSWLATDCRSSNIIVEAFALVSAMAQNN